MLEAYAYSDDELLALSGLQHLAYCERQWALIHAEQIWADSADTLRGHFFHERVDIKGYFSSENTLAVRSVRLTSYELGIYGIADIVEYDLSDERKPIKPIEYKVGRPKVEDWDRVQLAAQAICLEEMYDIRIDEAALFYGQTRRRDKVSLSKTLRERVVTLARRAHELAATCTTLLPERTTRCRRCSLIEECIPSLSGKSVRAYWEQHGEPLETCE